MTNLVSLYPLLLAPWALALLGLCIGSFLNVVIHRMPLMLERGWREASAEELGLEIEGPPAPRLTLSSPRSRCPCCGHRIRWHDNIPVVSYLFFLRGRCAACRTWISPRYPLIEVFTAASFAWAGWHFGAQPVALLWCGFMAVLVTLAGIDWDTTLLPDELTLPLLWAGLVSAAMGWTAVPLGQSLWGAVAGYLSLWSIYWAYKLLTKKDGMGHGDFKLLAALGAWLGVYMVLPVVLAASLIGAVVGIGMSLKGALREGRYVPFGPFLAGAGLAVLALGPQAILRWLHWV